MSFGQINGLDVNNMLSQSTSLSTTAQGSEVAEVAGENFMAQITSGQSSSVGVNTPSVVRAATIVSDRLPETSLRGREVVVGDEQGAFDQVKDNEGGNDGDLIVAGNQDGGTGDPGAGEIVIPEGSRVTEADLQNSEFDYNGDGVVTVAEAEEGLAINDAIIDVATMIGANAVMDMMRQMERDRAQAEQMAASGRRRR